MLRKLILCVLALSSLGWAQSLNGTRQTANLTVACTNTNTVCLATGALQVATTGFNSAILTINGTYSGVTINFDVSDDNGTTWYPDISQEAGNFSAASSQGPASNSYHQYEIPVLGNVYARVRLAAIGTGSLNVALTPVILPSMRALGPYSNNAGQIYIQAQNVIGTTDPCTLAQVIKSSTFQNITTGTTTQLVAPSGATRVYICGFTLSMTGTVTPDTAYLEYGTGGSCAGTTPISPTYSSGILTQGATTITEGFANMTIYSTPASQGVCVVSTIATTPTIGVHVTYVQQ